MLPSSRTPEGMPNRCPVCRHDVVIEPSLPPGDATCPYCGCLLWFASSLNFGAMPFLMPKPIQLTSQNKADALSEMLNGLVAVHKLPANLKAPLHKSLLHREELGSTGIGRGVAVPHAKLPPDESTGKELIAAVGLSRPGIDFASLDGEPVHIMFLLLSPANRPGDHLRALENISRHLRTDEFHLWRDSWLAEG